MKLVHEEPIDLEAAADAFERRGPQPVPVPRDRSAWHVTNLLESANLIARGDVRYHTYEGAPKGIMSLGRIWEQVADAYLTDWAATYAPDIHVERDGIVASLDGALIPPGGGRIHVVESKLRFTLKEDVPDRHWQQVSAYCYMYGTLYACMPVCRIQTRPPVAVARLHFFELTEQETAETWAQLTATKRYLEQQGLGPRAGGE